MSVVRGNKGSRTIWVSKRDYETMIEKGYQACPDIVEVPPEQVVWDVNDKTLDAKPLGIIRGLHFREKPENLKIRTNKVALEAQSIGMNQQIRIKDLVDARGIAKRTGRAQQSVSQWLLNYDDFPHPTRTIGTHKFWLFKDITAWLEKRGWPKHLGNKPRTPSIAEREWTPELKQKADERRARATERQKKYLARKRFGAIDSVENSTG